MGNKNLLLILGLVFSTLLSGKVYAGSVETLCAQNTAGYPAHKPANTANTEALANYYAITNQYDNCVSETYRMQNEQSSAPVNPGSPPLYDCAQYQQPLIPPDKFEMCKGKYEADKAQYDAQLAAYQNYISAHPNMNTFKELSPSQVLEDIAAKQQKASDKLKAIAGFVKTLGTLIAGIGAMMMATALAAVPFGWAAVGAAAKVIAIGVGLIGISLIIDGKAKKIDREKIESCVQLNKILTKPIACPDAQEQTPVDGTFTATNYGFSGIAGTSDIPSFIDPTTGKCKKDAPAECATLVKNTPAGCFKADKKGLSCMAGVKNSNPVTTLANGKISMNMNGKQRTFGAEDFTDEASMVKAGFTKDQAKQFLAAANDPNGILGKSGINAKGELIKGTGIPSVSLSKPSSSADGGATNGAAAMKMQKDEYGPVQEVARTPASAEGLTKDYHGEKIGAEGDDVFKMINRRYILKQKQNIFLEQ